MWPQNAIYNKNDWNLHKSLKETKHYMSVSDTRIHEAHGLTSSSHAPVIIHQCHFNAHVYSCCTASECSTRWGDCRGEAINEDFNETANKYMNWRLICPHDMVVSLDAFKCFHIVDIKTIICDRLILLTADHMCSERENLKSEWMSAVSRYSLIPAIFKKCFKFNSLGINYSFAFLQS